MISHNEMNLARENLFRAQERMGAYPSCWVSVNGFEFQMGPSTSGEQNVLACTLEPELLRDVLDRKAHWNNAEIGCLIRFNRKGPYLPDVHTLLSFFHLPRGA